MICCIQTSLLTPREPIYSVDINAISLNPFMFGYLTLIVDFNLGIELKRFAFSCYTAAFSSVFDLKNASLHFLSLCTDDDSHSNTPCRNPLLCSRHRERKEDGEKMGVFFHVARTHTRSTCSAVHLSSLPALSSCLQLTHQYSLWFPLRWKLQLGYWRFLTPVSI